MTLLNRPRLIRVGMSPTDAVRSSMFVLVSGLVWAGVTIFWGGEAKIGRRGHPASGPKWVHKSLQILQYVWKIYENGPFEFLGPVLYSIFKTNC